jgi:hypothetical protein
MVKRTDKTIAAIAVVLLRDGLLEECFTFEDDNEGNIAAEQKFKELAMLNGDFTEDEMEVYLEEGTVSCIDDVTIYLNHT